MNHKDEFDSLLDEVLSQYHNAEPLTRLEERVLQRLQLQGERRNMLRLRWGLVTAAIAILAVVWISVRPHWESGAPKEPNIASVTATPPSPNEAAPIAKLPAAEMHSHYNPQSKQQQITSISLRAEERRKVAQGSASRVNPATVPFPSQAPLTSQERKLLALAMAHPQALLNSSGPISELTILPIDIQPLADSTSGSKGNE